jgi:tetratricopeptide (TPR) repeat protein
MFCAHCGTETRPTQTACPSCGRPTDRKTAVAAGVLTPPPPAPLGEGEVTILAATVVAPISPDTSLSAEPVTSLSVEPVTSLSVEPVTSLPLEPVTSLSVEAVTSLPLEPVTSLPLEPVTSLPLEPVTRLGTQLTEAPGLKDVDATFLPPPESAVTLAAPTAPTGRRPTDRGRTTGTGRFTGSKTKSGPLEVGQDFGPRYHIIRVLGVGGMGAVYQAWDAELSEAVAVKVIRPEIAEDPLAAADIERRFKRELLLARQITHKNVVRIHDLGEIDGIKYITMTYVVGSDLATVLKEEGKLPVPRALRITRGIVSGLVSAHQAGVVHRDLKPANIMIGPDDAVTIMDFGIARSTGQDAQGASPAAKVEAGEVGRMAGPMAGQTMAGAIIGTVEYMAPEQGKGQPVDQRSDIYSLGLILYDVLVGRTRKHKGENALEELYGRMEKAPPSPCSIDRTIPGPVDAIVMRCLEPDQGKRFQTTVELLSALDRLDDKGKLLPIMQRVKRRTMAAVAVLVIALLGGTFYVTKLLTAPPVEHEPITVVLADFQNLTNDRAFDLTVGQTMRRALEDASFINAIDRNRVRSISGVAPPEKFDAVAARELAVKQGLGVVVAGSIDTRGDGFEISVEATHPLTGQVISTVKRRASSKDQVLDTVTRVVTSVRTALGDEKSASDQLLAMKSLSTTSLEVASQYAAAVDAQSRGKYELALATFSKAVELDPKFGLGYQGMAVMSRNLGRLQDAEKYAKEGLRYLDGMTERERLTTRGYYYSRIGDYQQCVKEYGDLIARYPADYVAHNQRAICMSQLRDLRGTVVEFSEVVRILPNHVVYRSNLALAMTLSGQFDAAEQVVRGFKEPYTRAIGILALSQLGRGLVGEARETYQKVSTMDAYGSAFSAAGLGDLAVYEGHFSEAVRLLEKGAAADLAAKRPDGAAMKFAEIAYAHLASGKNGPAVAAAELALKNSNVVSIRFLAGRIFAEAGSAARARTLATGLQSEVAAEPQTYGKIIEGLIALKAGDSRPAIKILTDANSVLDTWLGRFDLGRAYFAAKAFPQADSEFDRCIQRRGEVLEVVNEDPTYGLFPIVYYYQGRVREELKTASFADAYREYLKIRGQSKEDPLVPEVRKRIGN